MSDTKQPTKRRLSGFGGTTKLTGSVRNSHVQLTPMYAGIAGNVLPDGVTAEIGISIHDGSYTIDYTSEKIKCTQHPSKAPGVIENFVLKALMQFSTDHMLKFVACGMSQFLADLAPNLCNRLWLELDMVPMVRHIVDPAGLAHPTLYLALALPRPHNRQASPPGPAHLERADSSRTPRRSAALDRRVAA
jgi:hypothetical protein